MDVVLSIGVAIGAASTPSCVIQSCVGCLALIALGVIPLSTALPFLPYAAVSQGSTAHTRPVVIVGVGSSPVLGDDVCPMQQ